jgi:hypothetical protein
MKTLTNLTAILIDPEELPGTASEPAIKLVPET